MTRHGAPARLEMAEHTAMILIVFRGIRTDGAVCGVWLVPVLICIFMELGDNVFDGNVRQGRRRKGFWDERRH